MQEQYPIRARSERGFSVPYRALAVVALLVLMAGLVAACGSSGKKTTTSSTPVPSIHFQYPKTWALLPKNKWKSIGAPPAAAAVLQRQGNSANFVVLRGGKATINSKTAQKINDQLQKKYSDYKYISARKIKLPHISSSAMLFTYGRTKQGVLHTITIIPAAPISFIVETASPPNSKPIAKEIGKILKTANLTYPKK